MIFVVESERNDDAVAIVEYCFHFIIRMFDTAYMYERFGCARLFCRQNGSANISMNISIETRECDSFLKWRRSTTTNDNWKL